MGTSTPLQQTSGAFPECRIGLHNAVLAHRSVTLADIPDTACLQSLSPEVQGWTPCASTIGGGFEFVKVSIRGVSRTR